MSATLYIFCFNPLTGIRSFLTKPDRRGLAADPHGFNPLTGIRSFLTERKRFNGRLFCVFQSPHGDSFFSDLISWIRMLRIGSVSIPSRGFVLF